MCSVWEWDGKDASYRILLININLYVLVNRIEIVYGFLRPTWTDRERENILLDGSIFPFFLFSLSH